MAQRELLIDAYNVMFAHGRLGPLLRRDREQAREQFLVLVAQRVPADGTACYVVFDATRDPVEPTAQAGSRRGGHPGLHVVFARETADVWIQKRIREHPDPTSIAVVTADREILETARAYRAGSIRVSEFLQLPRPLRKRRRQDRATEKPEHESERQIEQWRRLFEDRRKDE